MQHTKQSPPDGGDTEGAPSFEEYLKLKSYSPSTRIKTTQSVFYLHHWCEKENIHPEQITYNELMDYVRHLREKGNSPRTQQIAVKNFKIWFRYLITVGARADNPADSIEIKDVKRKILYRIFTQQELTDIYNTYNQSGSATGKRNKIMLGLIIYQALRTEELAALRPQDIQLREGKIHIAAQRQTAQRDLKLEPHQLFDLQDYIIDTRRELLQATKKQSEKLFISTGTSDRFNNMIAQLKKQLQKKNPAIKTTEHLRCSVITHWLKIHNLRKVQYMAGHRYVSSTENYKQNDITQLQEEVGRFHPLG